MIATHESDLNSVRIATDGLNVLAIDEWVAYPPNSGKRVRTWSLLRRLANRHQITLLCYGEPEGEAADAVRAAGIRLHTVVPLPSPEAWRLYPCLIANLFSRYPYSVSKHYTRRLRERLQSLLSQEQFDLVHCEWTPYARFLPAVGEVPTLVMAHNIESQIWSRRAERSRTLIERAFFSLQARRMESFEREALAQAECVAAVTPLDAEQLRAWGVRHVSLVENGVDLDQFSPSPLAPFPSTHPCHSEKRSDEESAFEGKRRSRFLSQPRPLGMTSGETFIPMTATPKCHPDPAGAPEGSAFLPESRSPTFETLNHDTGEEALRPGPILFLGSLDWYPNLDAVDYLLKEIMPLILERLPGAKLQVVGKGAPPDLKKRIEQTFAYKKVCGLSRGRTAEFEKAQTLGYRRLSEQQAAKPLSRSSEISTALHAPIEFVGEVPDVRPYLAEADVVVVPLRIGGGSRIKILEALAMGKAVVSTSIGAEGLAVSDGIHLLLVDTPVDFASRTVELLTSAQKRRRLGENGRGLVVERYSWDRAAEALESAWQSTVESRQ
jgi:glycosyltransferase involved in cell wall biosynthesis